MNVVVLSFDQLALTWLGCYGNQWLQTRNFDRFATRAVVFDRCYAESVAPATTSHAWWDVRYRNLMAQSAVTSNLFENVEEMEVRLIALAEGELSEHRVRVDEAAKWRATGEGEDGTLAELIEAGRQAIEGASPDEQLLIWLKAFGSDSTEVPAIDFIERYAEDEGLEPTEEMLTEWLVIMSQPELFAQLDEDQQQDLQGIFAAARVMEMDAALGEVWDAIGERSDGSDWRLIVTSASGEGMRELSTNRVNVPLLIGCPTWEESRRRPELVSTQDVPMTILEWFSPEESRANVVERYGGIGISLEEIIRDPRRHYRDFICFTGTGGEMGLATKHYFLTARWDSEQKSLIEESQHLFVLPEDRSNKINVAGQDFEVTAALVERLTAFVHQIEAGDQPALNFFANPSIAAL